MGESLRKVCFGVNVGLKPTLFSGNENDLSADLIYEVTFLITTQYFKELLN
jgi:hypothetical protein